MSEAEAIAVRGALSPAVGALDAVSAAAGADASVVDLDGKTLMPGFIDAHTHVVSGCVVDTLMNLSRHGPVADRKAGSRANRRTGKVDSGRPAVWLSEL